MVTNTSPGEAGRSTQSAAAEVVAEIGAVPGGQDRRGLGGQRRQDRVTDEVHAAMDRVQPPGRDAVTDRLARQADGQKLEQGHHAVLTSGHASDRPIRGLNATCFVLSGDRDALRSIYGLNEAVAERSWFGGGAREAWSVAGGRVCALPAGETIGRREGLSRGAVACWAPVGPSGRCQAGWGWWRKSLRRLWVVAMSCHSRVAVSMPRRERRVMARVCLVCAKTGSTIAARRR